MDTAGRKFLFSSTTDADLHHALNHFDFDGVPVVMSDQLPIEPTGPVISNTEPSTTAGKHWVTFLPQADGVILFFDSYGLNCYKNPYYSMERYIPPDWRIRHVLGDQGKRSVQSIFSNVCGTYAVCEIISRKVFGQHLPDLLSLVEMPMDVDKGEEGVKLLLNDTRLKAFMGEIAKYHDHASLKRNKDVILSNLNNKETKQ